MATYRSRRTEVAVCCGTLAVAVSHGAFSANAPLAEDLHDLDTELGRVGFDRVQLARKAIPADLSLSADSEVCECLDHQRQVSLRAPSISTAILQNWY